MEFLGALDAKKITNQKVGTLLWDTLYLDSESTKRVVAPNTYLILDIVLMSCCEEIFIIASSSVPAPLCSIPQYFSADRFNY